MGITDVFSTSDWSSGRRRPAEYVTDRLEKGSETVSNLSRRVRHVADDRSVDELRERASDWDPDELRERATNWDRDELRDRLLERAVDELCTRYLDQSLEDLQEFESADGVDPVDRALESFLRRYDLEESRLDDGTLAAIRSHLAAEVDVDLDPEELLERLRSAEPSEADTSGASEETPIDALSEAYSTFRTDLDVESDQSITGMAEDVLEQDAVVVGHAVERLVTEELPRVREELEERRVDATGTDSAGSTAGPAEISIDDPGPEPTAGAGTARPTTALAFAAATLLSSDVDGDSSLIRALPGLASTLADDGGDPGLERALLGVVSTLLLETESGGLDLSALRSRSDGSLVLVALFVANLVAMTVGAWLSRERAPPIPDEIRGPNGETIVTDDQVRLGKKYFQANGLMNQGSILGNGSYFGVDLTAEALDLKVEYMRDYYARQHGTDSFDALEDDQQAVVAERVERELDADAPEGSIARYSDAEVYAHRRIREQYVDRYYGGDPERGVPQGYVDSPDAAERIADFACWTAWMAHTNRPGSDHSYTNDWPYVPEAGNRPTGQVIVWSTISVVLLIAGGGLGVWGYHALDFAEPTTEVVDVPSPDEVSITPAQYAAAWYVPVAGALFVAQALVGALLAHYYVERTGFYGIGDALGIDIVSLVPFSVGRTWHINLAVLWITTLWLAGGLFLPGLFSDRDPPWQAEGATVLLGALVVATVGAFVGVWLGIQGSLGTPEDGELWWLLGSEGLEYLETGRVWKLALLGALAGWTGLVLRSVRQLDEPPTGLGHFMTYAGGSIALMFGASMLYTPETNIAVTEFWRWWVVHMWVEGVFEFFVTAVISVALVSMELVDQADAEKAILFEVFAIMAAGIVGVSHHYWWVGLPDFWVPIGTTFSTLEFVPLIFILYRSIGEYRTLSAQGEEFPYTLPLLFIIGSSVWNFVGGGVLGFFINLPAINYFEHGTYLTVAHAHAATFGAFGLLALGLGTYILRVVTPEESWNPTWFRGAFWLTNVGLTVMTVASLLPIGFVQLRAAYTDGYAAARSLEFYEQDHVQTLLWARTLGDTPMILGALAFTVAAVRHLYAARGEALESS
ncbi:cbb3-type cytochrome c oxidase subunit I [Natronobacterium texcoconense]|uniref:Nitric oxide reductase subunit B n=1 Tax=Natronobacterium texcoconense TaxID=1095778 RepID=A0A1H1IBQ5_NATTX|nr:cbb3-type cytochrome c oxidase subunit I [Natronobacterium texcoconense]SDR35163.1 nitric oxide reductase subunit B [Natronobacterium texcoconense]